MFIEGEEDHEKAVKINNDIKKEEQIISRLIIAETINLLNNKLKVDKETIERVYESLNNDYTLIEDHYFYNDALKKTIEWDKRIPFFDFVFMSVMEELRIERIVTADKHFDLNKNIKRIH